MKKLIFVCGFNNYLGISEEYDIVNKTMYFENKLRLEKIVKEQEDIVQINYSVMNQKLLD